MGLRDDQSVCLIMRASNVVIGNEHIALRWWCCQAAGSQMHLIAPASGSAT